MKEKEKEKWVKGRRKRLVNESEEERVCLRESYRDGEGGRKRERGENPHQQFFLKQ